MGLHALFKGAKLEVESVIREVSDRLLSEPIPLADLRKRAVAIGILGEVYENVKKNEESPESLLMNGGAGTDASGAGGKAGAKRPPPAQPSFKKK